MTDKRQNSLSMEDGIIRKVADLTGTPLESISLDSELYYDLDLYGWDLDELMDFVADQYGIANCGVKIGDYAPGEGFNLVSWLAVKLGYRPYKSLTIRALLDWPRSLEQASPNRQENVCQ